MFWIHSPEPGGLAIAPRPHGGERLAQEIALWRAAGVDLVLSLLEPHEVHELELAGEEQACMRAGMAFLSFPILDRGVPESIGRTCEIVAVCRDRLREGQNLLLHCHGGIGRSSIMAACILASLGIEPQTAFERIEKARGEKVPDTADQRKWAEAFTMR